MGISVKPALLKYLSFGAVAFLVLIMGVATVLEKLYDTSFVSKFIYGSPYFIALWGICALAGLCYLIAQKRHKHLVAFLVHLSFVLILLGALVTHIAGRQGRIHLRQDEGHETTYITGDMKTEALPFEVSLKNFKLEYYPGTFAPMDFVSTILIHDGEVEEEGVVAMNHIYTYRHYRFYQSQYDMDGKGATLFIAHDPYGIAITYSGYALLLVSIILFMLQKDSRFRQLLRHPLLQRSGVICFLLLMAFPTIKAGEIPRALPKDVATKFCDLYIYYNDRICPIQTLAKDFTIKLCGHSTYKGLSSEEVLSGWLFYYDEWKEEPVIRIKNKEVQHLLGIKGSYARLTDFADVNGYKIEIGLQSGSVGDMRALEEANEKFNLISMVSTGSLLKIYPYSSPSQPVEWYSLADELPRDLPADLAMFIHNSMGYVAEMVAKKDYAQVSVLLDKIKKFQQKEAAGVLPSESRFTAEKFYNVMDYTKPVAMGCVLLGLVSFVLYCRRNFYGKRDDCQTLDNNNVTPKPSEHSGTDKYWLWFGALCKALMIILFIYLLILIGLRGYVGNHLPLSNGFETMQFMAWCTLLFTFILQRKFQMMLPFGFLVCGLALMVSMFGESNPQITQLMPVLQSPLLSVHVVVIMLAYSLLAFIMLNGVTAVILHYSSRDCRLEIERLLVISQILLYPAVFLLTIGIFIGAIWANVSWGRYWGWDPKEVWALITMLVYALALHPDSLPWFRRPMFFHLFSIAAFFLVLITYFGVNFLLGGMHSYAG